LQKAAGRGGYAYGVLRSAGKASAQCCTVLHGAGKASALHYAELRKMLIMLIIPVHFELM
jgi:hypothetical protein